MIGLASGSRVAVGTITDAGVNVGLGVLVAVGVASRLLTTMMARRLKMR
jgi:hypothetical protein